ncbi:hypothetical protein HPB49_017454 [Dermacentor silvarum]|uniref:Uncharacterized protein n=1 Tax=Dermacentor silvarum TaxID=543639 RepID=A0ACB8CGI0_DERSI|nr:hypothetical protein HPB49_017454 [Dermacentor silvarum]
MAQPVGTGGVTFTPPREALIPPRSWLKMAIMTAPSVFLVVVLLASSTHVSVVGELVELNENSWSQLLEGEWMVEFFAPWCPACKALGPVWNDFSKWSKDLGVKVAHVDVTTNPGLSGRFMVTALPTIYQMSMVSQFFKLSMSLRALHTTLVDYYGIPYWGSYILFALGTIVIGAVLGLLIVCIIDTVFPAKVPTYKPAKKSESDNEEEEYGSESEADNKSDDDVILDDTLEDKGDGEAAQLRRRNPEAVE